jgi:polyhydroxyalkanoate synthesis regulator phasin
VDKETMLIRLEQEIRRLEQQVAALKNKNKDPNGMSHSDAVLNNEEANKKIEELREEKQKVSFFCSNEIS